MAPMRREVSLIIRKPQLVGCQWILQPPAAVQQGARGPPASLQIGARGIPRAAPFQGGAGAAGWLCWKSISCSLGSDICTVALSITFQGISLCFLRPELLSLWKMRIWGCFHCWSFQHQYKADEEHFPHVA